MGEKAIQEPDEGKYMDQCYDREMTDKEIRGLVSHTKTKPNHQLYAVGWNENLKRVTYFRLMAEDESMSYLVTIEDGQFRVREETEDYKNWRTDEIPLPFKL